MDGDWLMSFYKVDPGTNELLSGPTVRTSDYYLTAETRGDYTLPLDGWSWFDSDLDALITLKPLEALKLLQGAMDEAPT